MTVSLVYLTAAASCFCCVPALLHLDVEKDSNTVGNASSFSLLMPLRMKRLNTF